MIESKPKNADVLCPFYERECPQGEATARLCWRRMNCPEQAKVDFDDYRVECAIADWMFRCGPFPRL